MALNNVRVESAKPRAQPYKLSDEKGLYRWCIQRGTSTHPIDRMREPDAPSLPTSHFSGFEEIDCFTQHAA